MMTLLDKINGWHSVLLSVVALGIGMTDINEWMKFVIYAITIIYMSWKWIKEIKKGKK